MLRFLKRNSVRFLRDAAGRLEACLDPNRYTLEGTAGPGTGVRANRYVNCRMPDGLVWRLNLNDHIDYKLFMNRTWDPELIQLSRGILQYKRATADRLICLDIGAHMGTWTLPVSGASDAVIAFEPASETFYKLEHNLKANGIGNVFPLRAAVVGSGANQVLRLNFNDSGNSGKSSTLPSWSASNASAETIFAVHLGALLRDVAPYTIALLKMDVEGCELDILLSLKGTVIVEHRPVIIFEWRRDYYDASFEAATLTEKLGEMLDFFATSGYRLLGAPFGSNAMTEFDGTVAMENVYCIPQEEEAAFQQLLPERRRCGVTA